MVRLWLEWAGATETKSARAGQDHAGTI